MIDHRTLRRQRPARAGSGPRTLLAASPGTGLAPPIVFTRCFAGLDQL